MGYIAQILVNAGTRSVNKEYSYAVPAHFDYLTEGWRVVVPFGGRQLEGFVMQVREGCAEDEAGLKLVSEVLDDDRWFDENMLAAARWISEYYICSLSDALRLFIPGKSGVKSVAVFAPGSAAEYAAALLSSKPPEYYELFEYIVSGKNVTLAALEKKFGQPALKIVRYLQRGELVARVVKTRRTAEHRYKSRLCLTEAGQLSEGETILRRRPAQLRLLQHLQAQGALFYDQLPGGGFSIAAAKGLIAAGLAAEEKVQLVRDSYAELTSRQREVTLTAEQETVLTAVIPAIENKIFASYLLHGITGSGKTQVYIEAAAAARAIGRQVIVLVPEIALTSQIVARFKARFGNDVAVMHSKLSVGERYDAWQRLRHGEVGIVIGARSAVFAPLPNIGLVILDEEHEFTYKQEETPRYHTKDVALQRARLSGAAVLLGSATPSCESYFEAKEGIHQLLTMKERINGAQLPAVTVVDMREELRQKRRSVISLPLQGLLEETAAQGEQAIILLNRRGYATFVMCRECGHVITCPHCDISLVYHAHGNNLRCHYCQSSQAAPDVCPKCASRYIRFFGTGTQKLEETLEQLFPGIRTVRMDQDTTGGKLAYDKILEGFARGDYDVLLGTQMVAKGHDVQNVTAVGIIAADSILNLPDFRAAERVFSLLAQAAGRAGRGDKAGRVVVQTYNPEHYAVQAGAHHNYEEFYETEIGFRRGLGYPPYGQLIKITVQGADGAAVRSQAQGILTDLRRRLPAAGIEMIGPFAAPVARVKDVFRFNVLLKGKNLEEAREELVRMGLAARPEVIIDVHPLSLM